MFQQIWRLFSKSIGHGVLYDKYVRNILEPIASMYGIFTYMYHKNLPFM